MSLDHSGEYLLLKSGGKETEQASLRVASTGEVVGLVDDWRGCPGADLKYFVRSVGSGISLEGSDGLVMLNLGIDGTISSLSAQPFTSDGKGLVWGNLDGSVMIADLDEIRARLAQVGLSW